MIELIKSDFYRYMGGENNKLKKKIKVIYDEEALIYLICFRINQRINKMKLFPIKIFLKILFSWTIYKLVSTILGIRIENGAQIGKGFYIGHFGQIFIGPIKIGENCNVGQGVTIGRGGIGSNVEGLPELGKNVWIGPGAKVFGSIKIGNNVSIGANSVVTKNIPDKAIVLGNPGRIIGYQENNLNIQNPFNFSE